MCVTPRISTVTHFSEDQRVVQCMLDFPCRPPVGKLSVDRFGEKGTFETSSVHLRLDRGVNSVCQLASKVFRNIDLPVVNTRDTGHHMRLDDLSIV